MCEKPLNIGIKKKINKPFIVINWWVTKMIKVPNNNIKIRLSFEIKEEKLFIIFLKRRKIGIAKAM